jgi:hypothetical protein
MAGTLQFPFSQPRENAATEKAEDDKQDKRPVECLPPKRHSKTPAHSCEGPTQNIQKGQNGLDMLIASTQNFPQ